MNYLFCNYCSFLLDSVDNVLLDLYGVEFGELPEATSLLRSYMLAYCHGKKHLVEKLADELTYYGYAGLQCHFTYHSLATATKGLKSDLTIEADDVWMTKLYKFAKKANAFREASLSKPGRALNFDLEDELLMRISQDETKVLDWLKNRITNANDWPYQCFMKEANGREQRNTLYLLYQKINSAEDFSLQTAEQFLSSEPWSGSLNKVKFASREVYIRAPTEVTAKGHPYREGQGCTKPATDIGIFVSYCPNPASCNVKKKVWVAWKKFAICFYQEGTSLPGRFMGHGKKEVWIPEKMLKKAERF